MKFIDDYVKKFIQKDYKNFESEIFKIDKLLKNKTCIGNNMLGWQDLDTNLDYIKNIAENINSNSDFILIIGIGGSYLGAKMAIDFLNPVNKNKIYFIGHNLDSEYLNNILNKIQDKKIHVIVISKSGNTIEIKAVLDIIINFIKKKYNKNINKYFTAVTGKQGFLRNFAQINNWQILDIPENIGGRFSVLTNVGLLPIAISGADIKKIILGAQEIKKNIENSNNNNYNYCYNYAIIRNILYKKNLKIELFSSFSTRMLSFMEWLKQLFGESEGKDNKGIFPASVFFSTDLHSLGQFIQEGSKILFETMFFVKNLKYNLKLSDKFENYDNYKSFNEINKKIFESILIAHNNGQVPCNIIEIDEFSELELGRLIYFFEFSCALSALMLGVNPFNQPGVELYKKIILN
ncbi:MAG: glucose-6-phosphate isomerase [Clostridia bacterium]|nr:glucose-6-phosphate isomerase [Clostridia bacterium]